MRSTGDPVTDGIAATAISLALTGKEMGLDVVAALDAGDIDRASVLINEARGWLDATRVVQLLALDLLTLKPR